MPTKTKEINEENIDKITVSKKTTKKSTVSKSNLAKTSNVVTKKTAKTSSSKKVNTKQKTVSNTKKTNTKSVSTVKKSKNKNTLTKKSNNEKKLPLAQIVEYYDLPYRYNETIVKILYQSPDTLFVYWDIADSDRKNYIKQYGENFFNITRPVLIVYNDTMNYSFEIPINDFANSWYLHINDSKCNYRVELGRRPNYYNQEVTKEIQENIKTDYIYVSSSNKIESPNDHVLFSTNQNNSITFRNIKNNKEESISLSSIVKRLPAMKKVQNIPYISEDLLKNLYSGIYENEDISLFERLSNPSSAGNPSSGSMSSRFNQN